MRNLKNTKGITLVALIITIIVLLILAMVSISLVINSGIITKSKTAVDRYSDEEIQEMIKTGYSEYKMAQFTGQALSLRQAINNSGLAITDDDITGDGPWTITVGEKSYILAVDGTVTANSSSSGSGQAVTIGPWTQSGTTVTDTRTGTTYDVGDTVYYNSGVAAYEGSGTNQGKWAILGVENGKLLIISKENVGTVTLSGKQGYLNGSTLLNNACSSFKNITYADLVRSIKIEDINNISGSINIPESETHTYTMESNFVKMDDNEPSDWIDKFEDIQGNELPENSPIPVTTNGIESQSFGIEENEVESLLNGNGQYWFDNSFISASDNAMWGFNILAYTGSNIDCQPLWNSYEGSVESTAGVRAVVTLKSNISLVQGTNGYTLQQ